MREQSVSTETETTIPQLHILEEQIRKVMDEQKVPGLALLLLKDDEVVLARGFGKRNVAQNLDVTPHTRFAIGSCGKAFTAAAIALLVQEGKLEWDTPVKHYLPTFKLQDQFATERMTPRDLLTHRCGLPRHEFLWYHSSLSREEVVKHLAYLEPNADFRTLFQYNNLMFVTAGYLIEHVTGQSWETFITERFLKPLGMNASTLSAHDMQRSEDYALPYQEEKDEVHEIPFYDRWQIIAPAGGIHTNLDDLQHWLRFQLNQGKHGETQLLDASQLAQNHAPQTVIPAGSTMPIKKHSELANWCYGMGWMIGSYKGHRIIQHGGSIDGFMAEIVLLPDDHAAVAVLTNLGSSIAPYSAAFSACDYLLGMEATDWLERLGQEFTELKEQQEKSLAEMGKGEQVPDTQPSHPLDAYCGVYEHPGYGTVTISCEDEQLRFSYNDIASSLTHFHYDIFELFMERFQFKAKVSFTTSEQGSIESLAVKLEPAVKAQMFTRVPDKETTA
ncbi:MAG TPA: serine hydrolase [Ktedonobacteraceae bacterium]|nr:serine hydrolase [Ktedonobacteraceae bacterium]